VIRSNDTDQQTRQTDRRDRDLNRRALAWKVAAVAAGAVALLAAGGAPFHAN